MVWVTGKRKTQLSLFFITYLSSQLSLLFVPPHSQFPVPVFASTPQSYDSFLCPEQNQWKWFALVRMADCTLTICAGTSSIITLKRVSAWLRLKYSTFTSKGTYNVWKQYNEWAPHSSQWTPEGLRYKFTQKIFLVMYDHKKKY